MFTDNALTIQDVIEESFELYDSENEFLESPLSDWFENITERISSKLIEPNWKLGKNYLQHLIVGIKGTNANLKKIEQVIRQDLLKPRKYTREELERAFGPPNKIYIDEIHTIYGEMVESFHLFLENARNCETTYQYRLYGVELDEIKRLIGEMISTELNSSRLPAYIEQKYKTSLFEPLQKYPKSGDSAFNHMLNCIKKHYNTYLESRLNGHKRISDVSKEISTINYLKNALFD